MTSNSASVSALLEEGQQSVADEQTTALAATTPPVTEVCSEGQTLSAASHESPTVDGSPEAVSGDVPTATQDEFSPADSLINAVREVVLKLLTVPMTDSQVAASLNVSVSQARAWLQRLVKEGTRNTRNKPVRSLCVLRLRCLLTLTTRRRCDAWARGGAEPLTSVLNVYESSVSPRPAPWSVAGVEAAGGQLRCGGEQECVGQRDGAGLHEGGLDSV